LGLTLPCRQQNPAPPACEAAAARKLPLLPFFWHSTDRVAFLLGLRHIGKQWETLDVRACVSRLRDGRGNELAAVGVARRQYVAASATAATERPTHRYQAEIANRLPEVR